MWIISKRTRKFFFLHIFVIPSLSRHEKRCWMLVRLFAYFNALDTHCLENWDTYHHGLWTPREKTAFTARPEIQSQSQIFRYGRSIFCLPNWPNFSDVFDLCLHWVSVVRAYHCSNIIIEFRFSLFFSQKHIRITGWSVNQLLIARNCLELRLDPN
jgi:hypothetical protein